MRTVKLWMAFLLLIANAPVFLLAQSPGRAASIDRPAHTFSIVARDPATGEMGKTIEEQTRFALMSLQSILEEAGATLKDVVHTTVLLADPSDYSGMNAEYAKFFPTDPPPRSLLGVSMSPGIRIEIEVVAYVGKK